MSPLEKDIRVLLESTVASIVQSLDYMEDLLKHTKWGGVCTSADLCLANTSLASNPSFFCHLANQVE